MSPGCRGRGWDMISAGSLELRRRPVGSPPSAPRAPPHSGAGGAKGAGGPGTGAAFQPSPLITEAPSVLQLGNTKFVTAPLWLRL